MIISNVLFATALGVLATGILLWKSASNPVEGTDLGEDYAARIFADSGEDARPSIARSSTARSPDAKAPKIRAANRSDRRSPYYNDPSAHNYSQFDSPRRGTIVRPDVGVLGVRPDAGRSKNSQRPDASSWTDPVNRRVLGPPSWMAELPPDEARAIEEILNRPIPPRYPIDLKVRRSSVELAAGVVDQCYARLLQLNPAAAGRFALNYVLAADGRSARFLDVNLSNVHKLDDPGFARCIVETLGRQSFPTSEDGRMKVAQPFFFN